MRFIVLGPQSICTVRRDIRGPGEYIESEEMGDNIEEFLRHKKIARCGQVQPVIGPKDAAPVDPNAPRVASGNGGKLAEDKAIVDPSKPHADFTQANTPAQTGKPVTPWTLNAADLMNKDLVELNAMVLERDPTITPFETKEEAIAQLSMDHGK